MKAILKKTEKKSLNSFLPMAIPTIPNNVGFDFLLWLKEC